jgi:serine/threonine protein kinase/Ran GTPase-activating protein (RanGAP) involved in mRNA processing and transport
MIQFILGMSDGTDRQMQGEEQVYRLLRQRQGVKPVLLRVKDCSSPSATRRLAEALATNYTLMSLDVSSNALGVEGAKAMAGALTKNSTLMSLDMASNRIGVEGAKAMVVALVENSTLTLLDMSGNGIGNEGCKAMTELLAMNSTITMLDLSYNVIGVEGGKAIAEVLATNSTLTSLDLSYNEIGVEGAKAMARALANNSTLTALDMSGNEIGVEGGKAMAEVVAQNSSLTTLNMPDNDIGAEGCKAMAVALAKNSTLTTLDMSGNEFSKEASGAISFLLKRNKQLLSAPLEREKVTVRTVMPPTSPLPLTHPSFAELRERCAADCFGAFLLDLTSERALVAAASAREALQRCGKVVEGVAENWRTVVEAQHRVFTSKDEREHARLARDQAVSKFISSSRALEETQGLLEELPLVVPGLGQDDREDAPLVSIAQVDALVTVVSEWLAGVDVISEVRMTAVSSACDAFVAAHDELGVAIGSRSTTAMKAAEAVCLERARAVEGVIAQVPVIPPSPLDGMPASQHVRVVAALRSQRSSILREISVLQGHRRELSSHGDTCPSTVEIESMRKKLKQASRKVQVLQLAHQHAVEDDEDVSESAAALDDAKSIQRSAARALDAEWLRLSLASTRWPELRFSLGDDVASARSIAVFDNHVTIAEGPPTTRFKVIRATAPDGKPVALKLFPLGSSAHDKATSRFMREAERLRRLRFDHIVHVRDVFVHVEGKSRFGVLELQYYGRGDMQQWLDGGEPRATSAQIRSVLRDALLGLSFCHGVGIVHADVKPANIFIGDDGAAVLGDFDVSHDDGIRLTTTVVLGATLAFMAPELRAPGARATKASDVFAFGKTIAHTRRWLEGDVASLVSRCTAAEPADRCTTEQALADNFFRGAACRADEWTSADCMIMAHCGGEVQHATAGVHCTSGHFVCTVDLEALISSRAESADEVQCPDPSCGTRQYEAALLVSTISEASFATWMRGKERRIEATLAAGMEAQYKQQLEAKLAEYSSADGDVKRHTDAIVERFINISCPRCRAVFVDFSDCTALTCGVSTCKAGFCAWCLADCGEDAHQHVPRCPENPAKTDQNADLFYTTLDKWNAAMAKRRQRLVKQYLEEDIHDSSLRRKVVERLRVVTGDRFG